MATPKDKLVKSQQLTAKKKKFFKILQSSDCFNSATLNDRLNKELDSKLQDIFEEERGNRLSNEPPVKENGENTAEAKVSKDNTAEPTVKERKRKKPNDNKKALKFPELVCGLNETLRLVKSQKVSMVWIDQTLAANLVNVLHKLCEVNQVAFLDLNLANLKVLMKVSTLSVVAFRTSVQEAESKFHSIYQLLSTTVFKSSKATNGSVKLNNNCAKHKEKPPIEPVTLSIESPLFCRVLPEISASINCYLARSTDPYSTIMADRLKTYSGKLKNEFETQDAFIAFSQPEEITNFPHYTKNERRKDIKLEFIGDQKKSKDQSRSSANKLVEKLFDIDKLNRSIDSRTTFKSPCLVKGQVPMEQSSAKKKRANQKTKMKANKKVCK